ncbi:MAG: hypothetical protein BAJALOKI1v1_450011 [Promethearchaeota archaeon]|nr:MAG: hypothetical protein BAJALOKI1v1_450011 [Candidatus Lokiarchaeota archaeon]
MSMNSLLIEKEIIHTINSYLEENKTFKVKKIIPYINSQISKKGLNLNQNGIKSVLSKLLKKKLIVEGSKLTRHDILENSKRQAIYCFVEQNPGSISNVIMNEVQVSNYELYWHLKMLEKFDYIKIGTIQGHTAYFATEVPPKEMNTQYILNKPKSKRILFYLEENDIGVTKTKIAEDLSMHFNTVAKYLDLLHNASAIIKDKKSNQTLYFPKK